MHSMDEATIKRLIYQSWYRGCKETDKLLGPFAREKLAQLPAEEQHSFADLLEEPDQDIWNWVVEREAPPQRFAPLIEQLRHYGVQR